MSKNLIKFIMLFISLLVIVVSSYFIILNRKERKNSNPKNNIEILIQTGIKKESLKSMYIAELIGLSVDKKINIYKFDENEAEKKLLKNPLIEKASIKKYYPNAVYIDYKLRKPIAFLYDFKNVGVDKNGFLFPIEPFLPSRDLPEIYIGGISNINEDELFKLPLNNKKFDLAIDIYTVLNGIKDHSFEIKRIDLSNAFLHSFGKKEIVIQLEHYLNVPYNKDNISYVFPRTIRLCVKDWKAQLSNYLSLNSKMILDYKRQLKIDEKTPKNIRFSSKIIDMRILKLAFIDE